VEPDGFGAIIDLRSRLVQGDFDLSGGSVVIGSSLAADLGIEAGDTLRVASSEGIEDVVHVAGIFTLGTEAVDESWVVTSLRHAQSLFALPGGATTIELKVRDIFAADDIARDLRGRTGLRSDSWMALNAELLSGLQAQSSSKTMIQFFVVVSVTLGIASVLVVSVVQRSREIGIRVALGADPRDVRGMVLRHALNLTLLGVAAGLAGALALSRVIAGLLFELSPTDPATLAAVGLALTAVALLASDLPARRATRVDPLVALRSE
jgi:lipoprotein-releasing system permease protein